MRGSADMRRSFAAPSCSLRSLLVGSLLRREALPLAGYLALAWFLRMLSKDDNLVEYKMEGRLEKETAVRRALAIEVADCIKCCQIGTNLVVIL